MSNVDKGLSRLPSSNSKKVKFGLNDINNIANDVFGPKKCPLCLTPLLLDPLDLQRHLINDHNNLCLYACHCCMKAFSSRDSFDAHFCEGFSQYLLKLVSSSAEIAFNVVYHVLICSECGLQLPLSVSENASSVTKLDKLLKNHDCSRLASCLIFFIEVPQFLNTVSWSGIPRLHNIPLVCSICSHEYASVDEIESHMSTHSSSADTYECSICGASFFTELFYINHILVHTNAECYITLLLSSTSFIPPQWLEKNKDFQRTNRSFPWYDSSLDYQIHFEDVTKLKYSIKSSKSANNSVTKKKGTSRKLCYYCRQLNSLLKTRPITDLCTCRELKFPSVDSSAKKKGVFINSIVERFNKEVPVCFRDETRDPNKGAILIRDLFFCKSCNSLAMDRNILATHLDICLRNRSDLDKSDLIALKKEGIIVQLTQSSTHELKTRVICPVCNKSSCSLVSLQAHLVMQHKICSALYLPEYLRDIDIMNWDGNYVDPQKIELEINVPICERNEEIQQTAFDVLKENVDLAADLFNSVTVEEIDDSGSIHTENDDCSEDLYCSESLRFDQDEIVEKSQDVSGSLIKCPFCDLSVPPVTVGHHCLKTHLLLCNDCGIAFVSEEIRKKHSTSCQKWIYKCGGIEFFPKCSICGTITASAENYYVHLVRKHHQDVILNPITLQVNPLFIFIKCTTDESKAETTASQSLKPSHRRKLVTPPMEKSPDANEAISSEPPAKIQKKNLPESIQTEANQCFLCELNCESKELLENHMVRHTEKWINCPFCNYKYYFKSTSSIDELFNHVIGRHIDKLGPHMGTVQCCFCGLLFGSSDDKTLRGLCRKFISHVIFECDAPTMCFICNSKSVEDGDLARHRRDFHSTIYGCVFLCVCGDGVEYTKEDFMEHFKLHLSMACDFCTLCSETISSSENWFSHAEEHCNIVPKRGSPYIMKKEEILPENQGDITCVSEPALSSSEVAGISSIADIAGTTTQCTKNVNDSDFNSLITSEQIECIDTVPLVNNPGIDRIENDNGMSSLSKILVSSVEETTMLPEIKHSKDAEEDDVQMLNVVMSSNVPKRDAQFHCDRCTSSFLTQSAFNHHMTSHKFDAGNTLEKVYGIPLNEIMHVCRICCLAYESEDVFRKHENAHLKIRSCAHCSLYAYDPAEASKHQLSHSSDDQSNRNLFYVCAECTLAYTSEERLYYHTFCMHKKALIYFCKNCSLASTNGKIIFAHVIQKLCNPQFVGDVTKNLGATSAALFHYQPLDPNEYEFKCHHKTIFVVVPSECVHRSFLIPRDDSVLMTCSKCFALVGFQRFTTDNPSSTMANMNSFRQATDDNDEKIKQLRKTWRTSIHLQMAPKMMPTRIMPTIHRAIRTPQQYSSNFHQPNFMQDSLIQRPRINSFQAFRGDSQSYISNLPTSYPSYTDSLPLLTTRSHLNAHFSQPSQVFHTQRYPLNTAIHNLSSINPNIPLRAVLPFFSNSSGHRNRAYGMVNPPNTNSTMFIPNNNLPAIPSQQFYPSTSRFTIYGQNSMCSNIISEQSSKNNSASEASSLCVQIPKHLVTQNQPILPNLNSNVTTAVPKKTIKKRNQLMALDYYSPDYIVSDLDGAMRCKIASCQCVMPNVRFGALHNLLHNVEDLFFCMNCGRSFRDERSILQHMLQDHLRIIQPDLSFKCPICVNQNNYSSIKAFRAHLGDRNVKDHSFLTHSSRCSLLFRSAESQKDHDAIAHKSGGCCVICGTVKNYWYSSDFVFNHTMIHGFINKHICRTCGTLFPYTDKCTHFIKHFRKEHMDECEKNCLCERESADSIDEHIRQFHLVVGLKMTTHQKSLAIKNDYAFLSYSGVPVP